MSIEQQTENVDDTQGSAAADLVLAQRLERLAARGATPTRPPTSPPGGGAPRRKRRHAAKGSRLAALALSLVTTGGLTAAFAATDGPANSVIVASGGVVTAGSTAAPAGQSAASPLPPVSTAAPAAPSTSTAAPATTPNVSVVNGDVYSNKWGPVQVQAAFSPDGSLVSVDAIQSPTRDSKSLRINDRAVPALNTEALAAQSSNVDTVSGATYTSHDYARSLQSAIDEARVAGLTQIA